MIKAILFDYDGVITVKSAGEEAMPARLGALLGVEPRVAQTILAPLWPSYVRGNISDADLWRKLEAKSGTTVAPQDRNIWISWPEIRPLPVMVAFVKKLRRAGIVTGLLTNVTPTTEADVRAHGGYDGFDFLIKSCEVGFAKPDTEIYQLALQRLPGLRPEDVLFIDDRQYCLPPAQALGIKTLLSENATQVIADVSKQILL